MITSVDPWSSNFLVCTPSVTYFGCVPHPHYMYFNYFMSSVWIIIYLVSDIHTHTHTHTHTQINQEEIKNICKILIFSSCTAVEHPGQSLPLPLPWWQMAQTTRSTKEAYITCVNRMSSTTAKMHAQSCPSLCIPLDYNPPGSSVHEIFQARKWSGLPFPPPGDLLDPGIEPKFPVSPELQVDSSPAESSGKPGISRKVWLMWHLKHCRT